MGLLFSKQSSTENRTLAIFVWILAHLVPLFVFVYFIVVATEGGSVGLHLHGVPFWNIYVLYAASFLCETYLRDGEESISTRVSDVLAIVGTTLGLPALVSLATQGVHCKEKRDDICPGQPVVAFGMFVFTITYISLVIRTASILIRISGSERAVASTDASLEPTRAGVLPGTGPFNYGDSRLRQRSQQSTESDV